ncbi:acyl carrier protein [Streptomyces sp. NRRL B-3648]|uniref:acyl carrier protein n=1 Tax=Streptomyces sp. NRRL B-3648 TaxID=1519493 RepID=UPI0006AF4817|nr:acyl carrier protein [Streptomyces sp. NRRL B-3648]
MTASAGYAFPAHLFDCLQVNLAERADHWHGPGTALRLGAVLRFRPAPAAPAPSVATAAVPSADASGLPTVERTVVQQLDDARRYLGLAVRSVDHDRPFDAVPPGEGRYVVADAFFLPWVPYHRRQHMDHSFLLLPGEDGGGAVCVRDGYLNDTPWGSARPGEWRFDQAALADLGMVKLSVGLTPADPSPLPPPLLDLACAEETDEYVTAYEQHPDRTAALRRLTLETWLLCRGRELHAAYLARYAAGGVTDRVRDHVTAWKTLAEQVYLAYRRVERGRAEPVGPLGRLRELLLADPGVFARPGSDVVPAARPDDAPAGTRREVPGHGAGDPRAGIASVIAAVAAETLGADPAALLAGASLGELPEFNSFRIVELVERLEERFGIEFRPDDLVPENLHRVEDLHRAVERATPATPIPAAPTPAPGRARTPGTPADFIPASPTLATAQAERTR